MTHFPLTVSQGVYSMRWKWIAAGAAGLLVIAVIAFYAILMSYDFNQFKPDIIQEVKAATGRELTLGGDIELKVSLSPSLVVEQVALSNAKWGSRAQMISAKRVEVRIELIPLLFSEIKLDKLVLIEPDVLIEINTDGRSNLDFLPPAAQGQASQAKAEKPSAPAKAQTSAGQELSLPPLTFRELRIEKGLVTYHDMKSQEKRTLALESLKGSLPGMDKPVKLEVKGAVDGEGFSLAGTVGALDRLAGGGSPWPVEVALGFRGATLNLKGSIENPLQKSGLDLEIKAKGDDLAKLAPKSGLGGPFSLECKLSDPKAKVYKVSGLKLSAHGSDLAGWLQVEISGKRPVYTAEIKIGVLDLVKLPGMAGPAEADQGQPAAVKKASAGKASQQGKQAQAKRGGKVFPSDPLPLEALQNADADIKISAQKVVRNQLTLEGLELGLKLAQGKLALQPLSGKLCGGDLKASLSLTSQGKSARADFQLSLIGCQAGDLLAGLGQDKIVEASMDIKSELTGSGTSIAGIMAGLNGKLIATLQKGRINNQYLEVAGGDLGPVLGNIIAPTAKGQPNTQLNCMVMGFRVVKGLAKSNVILLNTENMVVLGEGRVNLASEEIDLVMHPSPKKSLTQKATGGLAGISLGELTKPFKLTGTLARPRVGIDEVGAITTLAKTVGGFAILGPLGAAAGALTSTGAGEEAGCAEALAAAHSGGKFEPKPAKGQAQEGKTAGGQEGSTGQKFEKDVEEGVNKLKSLFGN
jgi:uncharacterized protein involved in outer membrane biogenesis